jgi:hypothetical protein
MHGVWRRKHEAGLVMDALYSGTADGKAAVCVACQLHLELSTSFLTHKSRSRPLAGPINDTEARYLLMTSGMERDHLVDLQTPRGQA